MSWSIDGASFADLAASSLAVALDASVRGALLLGAAAALGILARNAPARWRHALWATALVGLAALPAIAVLQVGPAALTRTGGPVETALAAVWALGFAALVLRHQRASRALRAHLAITEPGPHIPGARVRIGGGLASPVTFGFRPVVLLPADFHSWPEASRRQVLLHEAAHVARHDWASQRLAAALCHALWFHPLVWVARRMLILEAERAADEAVLRSGERPSEYAQLLLDRSSPCSPAPALAAPRWLELRVRSLLGPGPGSRGPAMVGVLALIALTPMLSAVHAAPSPPAAHCDPSAVALADTPKPLSEQDDVVRHAGPANAALHRHLRALPPAQYAATRTAADRLVRSCPYNRASAGLPELVHEVLRPHYALLDREEFGWATPVMVDRMTVLKDALEHHLEVIDALGLTNLPAPKPGDFLANKTAWTQASLPVPPMARGAYMDDALRSLDAVPVWVSEYDDATRAVIDETTAVLAQATDDRWPMKVELMAYRTTLMELAALAGYFADRSHPEIREALAALAADCARLIEVLDRYIGMRC